MAVVINLSDPGAVPGDSTNSRDQATGVRDQETKASALFLIPDYRHLIPDNGVETGSTRA
jgi:hypothetical protein